MIECAEIDEENNRSSTPLTVAIDNNHADITQLLLERGANPNIANSLTRMQGELLNRAAKIGSTAIINQLLKYGALPDSQKNHHHRTALHAAVLELQPRSILALYPCFDGKLKDLFDKTPIERLIGRVAKYPLKKDTRLMQCLYAFLWKGTDINENLVSQIVGEGSSAQVMHIIQKTRENLSILKCLFSSRVIMEFIASSNVKHGKFLEEIFTIRSCWSAEIWDQIAFYRLTHSEDQPALDSHVEQNRSCRR